MSTITLQNFRVGSDLTVKVRLKDGGVAIDWSTLSGIRAVLYSDAQSSIAGRCDVTVDGEDPTLLVCRYAATKMQYLGVNRIVVSAKYMGVTKTYDKPAFTFVRWTEDQAGEEITIEDPEVTVEIDVEDVSSSILQEAVDAAFSAADRANEAAEAAEHMVDIHTGPEGKSAYEVAVEEGYTGTEEEWLASLKGPVGETPDISIGTVTTVEPGTPAAASMSGTPEAPVLNLSIPKGLVGATPNITVGTVTTGQPGTPVVVTITGTPEAPVLNVTIPQGLKGDTGVSADYPITIHNGLDSDATDEALAAAQGKILDGKVSQLEAEVTELDLSVNGGTKDTPISTAQDVAVMRINAGNGNMTTSSSTDYSVCSFPVENGKTYKLKIPKLSSQYTAAYSFNNAQTVSNGITSDLPDPVVKGPLEDYETQVTIGSATHTYLDVCYETAYGKPTLTIETQVVGLTSRVADLEDSVEDISGDMETLSGNVETIEDDVADLDSAVNGGTEVTTIQPSNTEASIRIAKPAGTITTSAATDYSICTFPVELGKQYKLTIPKLTSAYAYAFGYISNDNIQAGDSPILPDSPVSGPLDNYQTNLTPMQTTGNQIFLIVTFETSGGVPTLTTETTTGGLVGDVENLKESVDALQKGGKITIKKVSDTEIDLYIPNKENTAYLIHPIIRDGYTLDLSAEGGSSAMVCGDLYDPGDIVDAGNNAIVQGNLNFIFMVDADASGSGYENEGSYHVGSGGGHGLEVMDYALFFADGKQFSISEMTEDIVCSEFRLVQKSKCYAVDNTHNTGNTHNYPKLVNGEPIVTAEHYLDAIYKPGNIIKWRNQLNIKRDHIVFKQLHAGMLRPYSTHLSKMVVSDNKMSRCEWGTIGGVWTVTYIPESNSLLPNTIKADEVFVSGDSTISVYQRMFQDNGARYDKSRMMFAEYSSTNSLKSYFMPAIVSRGSASQETFNSGDILSVTNIREINI